MLRIHVRAPVRPTEDPEKVRRAILAVFPRATLETRRESVEGTSPDLERLAELVRNHQIPDSARAVLLRGRQGATTRSTFLLGKQAAAVGAPNLGTEAGPLGEISVTLEADDERELLYAIYAVGFDTKVDEALSRVPREYRPATLDAPAEESSE